MVYSDRLVPSTIRWNPLLLTCVPRRRTHTLRRRSDDAFSSFVSGYGQESLTKCTANQLNINSPFNMVNHVSEKMELKPLLTLLMYSLTPHPDPPFYSKTKDFSKYTLMMWWMIMVDDRDRNILDTYCTAPPVVERL